MSSLLTLTITPAGRLRASRSAETHDAPSETPRLDEALAERLGRAFQASTEDGLLELAAVDSRPPLPLELVFWRDWTRRLLNAIARLDEERFGQLEKAIARGNSWTQADATRLGIPPPDELALAVLVAEAPPMPGLENLTPRLLQALWSSLLMRFAERARDGAGGCRGLLGSLNPETRLLGRVTFHLAENKRDPSRPFAFLATWASRLSARAQLQHLPLAEALRQYAAERDQAKLAELLAPVRDAAAASPLVAELLSSRAIFQAQAWSIAQASRFLGEVAAMESAGLAVRVPDWWAARRSSRPVLQVRLGDGPSSAIGLDALLDFSAELAIDGQPLDDAERAQLLAATDGLALLRGKWVEVDQAKLREALAQWRVLESGHAEGVTFLEGLRLLAGAQLDANAATDDDPDRQWTRVVPGEWLSETLRQLRTPAGISGCEPGRDLKATLRPYQIEGVRWLWFMLRLGFGACLADDMGLGKTIQVIDLILRLRQAARQPSTRNPRGQPAPGPAAGPVLIVVPASLLGNWKQEFGRFAPQLKILLAHRSECDAETLARIAVQPAVAFDGLDVVITTYSLIRQAEWPVQLTWRLVVLDEAQAIKNAGSAQSRAVRLLRSSGRIALTGTPVENQLGDLWSLFDFCMPGLLGNARQFRDFARRIAQRQDASAAAALRKLVRPCILRRMKTDPEIVPDLPDKAEVVVHCGLSKQQAVLYEKLVRDVARQIGMADGIQRRGLVLSLLLRLKQLCNHPAQYLDQPDFPPAESGKFGSLREVCEQIRDRQEKLLLFSQFQSICAPLAEFLATIFGRPGLVLHGGIAVGKRKALVERFQTDEEVPFFVISVKAGGTGLNLTAASHVIHFDRWWNPAVENQATDRAFRIGQKRNVLVHKFVCRGTLEERIDLMIRDKQQLADEILGGGAEALLTELSDSELMKFVALDITRATGTD